MTSHMARVAVERVVVSDGGGEFLGNVSSDDSDVIEESMKPRLLLFVASCLVRLSSFPRKAAK